MHAHSKKPSCSFCTHRDASARSLIFYKVLFTDPVFLISYRPLFKNPPKSVGLAIGATNASAYFNTTTGGQSPQMVCRRRFLYDIFIAAD